MFQLCSRFFGRMAFTVRNASLGGAPRARHSSAVTPSNSLHASVHQGHQIGDSTEYHQAKPGFRIWPHFWALFVRPPAGVETQLGLVTSMQVVSLSTDWPEARNLGLDQRTRGGGL